MGDIININVRRAFARQEEQSGTVCTDMTPEEFLEVFAPSDPKQKVALLADTMRAANDYAWMRIEGMEDGGTCNFDSPVLRYNECNLSKSQVEDAMYKTATIGRVWKIYGKLAGMILIPDCVSRSGQAFRRSMAAEAYCDYMTKAGYPMMTYCQMD